MQIKRHLIRWMCQSSTTQHLRLRSVCENLNIYFYTWNTPESIIQMNIYLSGRFSQGNQFVSLSYFMLVFSTHCHSLSLSHKNTHIVYLLVWAVFRLQLNYIFTTCCASFNFMCSLRVLLVLYCLLISCFFFSSFCFFFFPQRANIFLEC